jgi:hypothetical protein
VAEGADQRLERKGGEEYIKRESGERAWSGA